MVEVLGVKSALELAKVTHIFCQMVQAKLPPAILLCLLPVHLEGLKEAGEYPASINPSSTHHNAMAPFLFSQPIPNSMIVHSSAKSKGVKPSMSPDQDSRKVDSFACKNYSVATMLARVHMYLP